MVALADVQAFERGGKTAPQSMINQLSEADAAAYYSGKETATASDTNYFKYAADTIGLGWVYDKFVPQSAKDQHLAQSGEVESTFMEGFWNFIATLLFPQTNSAYAALSAIVDNPEKDTVSVTHKDRLWTEENTFEVGGLKTALDQLDLEQFGLDTPTNPVLRNAVTSALKDAMKSNLQSNALTWGDKWTHDNPALGRAVKANTDAYTNIYNNIMAQFDTLDEIKSNPELRDDAADTARQIASYVTGLPIGEGDQPKVDTINQPAQLTGFTLTTYNALNGVGYETGSWSDWVSMDSWKETFVPTTTSAKALAGLDATTVVEPSNYTSTAANFKSNLGTSLAARNARLAKVDTIIETIGAQNLPAKDQETIKALYTAGLISDAEIAELGPQATNTWKSLALEVSSFQTANNKLPDVILNQANTTFSLGNKNTSVVYTPAANAAAAAPAATPVVPTGDEARNHHPGS